MELFQFLIDFTRHDNSTLSVSSVSVLPHLLNGLVIKWHVFILLVKCLRHPIVSFPSSRGPNWLVLIVKHPLTLINYDVPVLQLQLNKCNIKSGLHLDLLPRLAVPQLFLLPNDAENFEVFGWGLLEFLCFVLGGCLVFDFLSQIEAVFAALRYIVLGRRCVGGWSLSLGRSLREASSHVSHLLLSHVFGVVEVLVAHIAHLLAHHFELGRRDIGEHGVESLAPVNMGLQLLIRHILEHLSLLTHHVVWHIHVRKHS